MEVSSARTCRELEIFPRGKILRRPLARALAAASIRSSHGTVQIATTTLSEWDMTSEQGSMVRNKRPTERSKTFAKARILVTTVGHFTLGKAPSMAPSRWTNGSNAENTPVL